ncbi:MAG: MarR family transcriptional regulator [Myxococcota bacterium]
MRTQANAVPEASTGARPRVLREAVRRLIAAHAALEPMRRPCGAVLTLPHAWTLLELKAEPGLTLTTLASRLNIDRSNVSRLCARLESEGELRREPCPDDGRALRLRLTAKGRRAAARVDRGSAQHFAVVWQRLGRDGPRVLAAVERLSEALAAPEAA